MYKFYIIIALSFSACSNITFNATMCDQIASEPNAVIPKECRVYSEEDAQKAFDKTKAKQDESLVEDDIVEFNKKQQE